MRSRSREKSGMIGVSFFTLVLHEYPIYEPRFDIEFACTLSGVNGNSYIAESIFFVCFEKKPNLLIRAWKAYVSYFLLLFSFLFRPKPNRRCKAASGRATSLKSRRRACQSLKPLIFQVGWKIRIGLRACATPRPPGFCSIGLTDPTLRLLCDFFSTKI